MCRVRELGEESNRLQRREEAFLCEIENLQNSIVLSKDEKFDLKQENLRILEEFEEAKTMCNQRLNESMQENEVLRQKVHPHQSTTAWRF